MINVWGDRYTSHCGLIITQCKHDWNFTPYPIKRQVIKCELKKTQFNIQQNTSFKMHKACRNAAKAAEEGLAGKCWVAFQGPDFWVCTPSFTAVALNTHCNHRRPEKSVSKKLPDDTGAASLRPLCFLPSSQQHLHIGSTQESRPTDSTVGNTSFHVSCTSAERFLLWEDEWEGAGPLFHIVPIQSAPVTPPWPLPPY